MTQTFIVKEVVTGAELGFPHAMWYDSGIIFNGRCFYIYHSGNWNGKTYLLDQNTPKLRLINAKLRIFLNDVLELLGSNKMSYESYAALFIKTWGRESYNHPKKSEEILKAICTYPKFQSITYSIYYL